MARERIRRELQILQSVSDEVPMPTPATGSLHGRAPAKSLRAREQKKKVSPPKNIDSVESLRKQLKDATDGRAEMEREFMNAVSSLESEKRATSELLDERTRKLNDSVESLRKQLKDATDGRAEMEREFMNAVSSFESEKRAASELLDERTRELHEMRKSLSDLQAQADESQRTADKDRSLRKSEMNQLEADSLVRDSHLKAKCRELEDANAALVARFREKDAESEKAIGLKTENEALRRKLQEMKELNDSVGSLRKQLKDATNSRAEMEREFMMSVSSFESEKRATSELLDEKTRELHEMRKSLSDLQAQADESQRTVDKDRALHQSEMNQLEADSLARDSHLKAKCRELEDANAALVARFKEKDAESEKAIGLKTENEALRRQLQEMKNEVEILKSKGIQEGVEAYEKLIQHMRTRADSQQTEMISLKADVEERDTLIETRNREVEELRSGMKRKNEENETLRSRLATLGANDCVRDSQLQKKTRQLDDTQSELTKKSKEIEDLQMEAKELRRQHEEERRRCDEMEKEMNVLASNHNIASKQLNEKLDRLESAVAERDSRLEAKRKEMKTQQTEIDHLKADVAERETLLKTRKREVEELHSNVKAKDIENETLRSTLTTLETDACVRDSQLQTKTRQLDDAQSELTEKMKEKKALRMEAEELRRQREEERRRRDEMEKEMNVIASNRDLARKQLDERLQRLESAVAERDSRLEAKRKEIETLKSELEKRTELFDVLTKEEDVKRKEIQALNNAKDKENEMLRSTLTTLEADSCVRDSQLQTKTRQLDDAQSELTEKVKENEALRIESKELRRQHEEERQRCDEMEKEIKVLASNRDIASKQLGEKLDRLESAVAEKDSCLEAKSKEIKLLKSVLKTSTEQVDVLAKEETSKRKEIETLKSVLKTSTDQVGALARDLENIREKHGVEMKRANDLHLKLNELTSERSATSSSNEGKESALRSEIRRLEAELAEKASSSNALVVEIEAVETLLKDSQKRNDGLEREMLTLKERLNLASKKAEAAGEEHLKELKLRTAQTMNEHNCEVETLRKELTAANMEKAELDMKLINMQNELDILEKAKATITSELEEQLEDQTSNSLYLQSTLKAKEDEIVAMQTEMAALHKSMKELASCRRDEVEEMESELVQKTQRIAEQERNILSLKTELSERNVSNQIPIAEARPITPTHSEPVSPEPIKGMKAIRDKQIIEELSSENKELREEVAALVAELHRLREKFRDLRDRQDSSSTVKVLRARNETLKKEVERTTRRLKSLEKSITRISC